MRQSHLCMDEREVFKLCNLIKDVEENGIKKRDSNLSAEFNGERRMVFEEDDGSIWNSGV